MVKIKGINGKENIGLVTPTPGAIKNAESSSSG